MVYGAGEAVELAPVVTTPAEGTEATPIEAIKFGKGEGTAATLVGITEKGADDTKVRFVYDVDGMGTGAVFAGNKLVSSKILDIKSDEVFTHVENVDGEDIVISHKKATKLTVTWFGKGIDNRDEDGKVYTGGTTPIETVGVHTTVFDLVDPDAFKQLVEDLEARVKSIEDYDASTGRVKVAEGSALTVTPTTTDIEVTNEEGKTLTTQTVASWELAVNADEDSIKTVTTEEGKAVLATAKYELKKLDTPAEKGDEVFAAQYQLMMTDPATGVAKAVGDTINIARDFLLKGAHVCTFNLSKPDKDSVIKFGESITWETADGTEVTGSVNKGDQVVESLLPWAFIGTDKDKKDLYEIAVLDKGIEYGHTYLHLVLNTKGDDELENPNALETDVFLDFTDIFSTFKGDDKYITVGSDGVISLGINAVATDVDDLLGKKFDITEDGETKHQSLTAHVEATEKAVADHLAALDEKVDTIGGDYVKSVELATPKAEGSQFNNVKLTVNKTVAETGEVKTETVEFDIANADFYTALNAALAALKKNDEDLATLLTWSNLG